MSTTFYPSYSSYAQSRFMKQGNPPSFPNNTFGVGAMVRGGDSVSFNKPKPHFGGEFEEEATKAAGEGNITGLKNLLSQYNRQPVSLRNIINSDKYTLLHLAAETKILSDPMYNNSPSYLENCNNPTAVIQYLYELGVPIDAQTHLNQTALQLAAFLGCQEQAKLLHRLGASLSKTDIVFPVINEL